MWGKVLKTLRKVERLDRVIKQLVLTVLIVRVEIESMDLSIQLSDMLSNI
jgi:hypothetical protein